MSSAKIEPNLLDKSGSNALHRAARYDRFNVIEPFLQYYSNQKKSKQVSPLEFKDAFGELGGEKLKTAPRGFSRDHPNIHWLRYKDFIVGKPISDKEIMEDQFLDYAVKSYYNMLPLKRFLNKRLEI